MHDIDIKKYDGSLEELARDIVNLRYDRLAILLYLISIEIKKDSEADKLRKRFKLSKKLLKSSKILLKSADNILDAWMICKPFMKDEINE